MGALALIGTELKKRLFPVILERNIQTMLTLLNSESRRHAVVLLRALKDVDDSVVRATSALKALQKSIEYDLKRLNAIENDILLRRARESKNNR